MLMYCKVHLTNFLRIFTWMFTHEVAPQLLWVVMVAAGIALILPRPLLLSLRPLLPSPTFPFSFSVVPSSTVLVWRMKWGVFRGSLLWVRLQTQR